MKFNAESIIERGRCRQHHIRLAFPSRIGDDGFCRLSRQLTTSSESCCAVPSRSATSYDHGWRRAGFNDSRFSQIPLPVQVSTTYNGHLDSLTNEEVAMVSAHTQQVADRAKALYADRLQVELEAHHLGRYVAIEPESGEYFLADSFGDAVADARNSHPQRISFVIRIGYDAALHLGGLAH
jgi:hypothetical protein